MRGYQLSPCCQLGPPGGDPSPPGAFLCGRPTERFRDEFLFSSTPTRPPSSSWTARAPHTTSLFTFLVSKGPESLLGQGTSEATGGPPLGPGLSGSDKLKQSGRSKGRLPGMGDVTEGLWARSWLSSCEDGTSLMGPRSASCHRVDRPCVSIVDLCPYLCSWRFKAHLPRQVLVAWMGAAAAGGGGSGWVGPSPALPSMAHRNVVG